jgi:hypothetical protein
MSAFLCVPLLLALTGRAASQTTDPIQRMRTAIERGAGDSVRTVLAELRQAYPNDAGYVYLSAIIELDGDRALRLFQSILQSFPASEWADDALMRLYQYHYAIGAYNTADRYWSRLETDYPDSPYLLTAASPTSPAATPAGIRKEPAAYAVQIGLYDDRDQADEALEKMKKLGYTGDLYEKHVGEKRLTAVRVGSFLTSEEALAFSKKLKSRHRLDGIVVKR